MENRMETANGWNDITEETEDFGSFEGIRFRFRSLKEQLQQKDILLDTKTVQLLDLQNGIRQLQGYWAKSRDEYEKLQQENLQLRFDVQRFKREVTATTNEKDLLEAKMAHILKHEEVMRVQLEGKSCALRSLQKELDLSDRQKPQGKEKSEKIEVENEEEDQTKNVEQLFTIATETRKEGTKESRTRDSSSFYVEEMVDDEKREGDEEGGVSLWSEQQLQRVQSATAKLDEKWLDLCDLQSQLEERGQRMDQRERNLKYLEEDLIRLKAECKDQSQVVESLEEALQATTKRACDAEKLFEAEEKKFKRHEVALSDKQRALAECEGEARRSKGEVALLRSRLQQVGFDRTQLQETTDHEYRQWVEKEAVFESKISTLQAKLEKQEHRADLVQQRISVANAELNSKTIWMETAEKRLAEQEEQLTHLRTKLRESEFNADSFQQNNEELKTMVQDLRLYFQYASTDPSCVMIEEEIFPPLTSASHPIVNISDPSSTSCLSSLSSSSSSPTQGCAPDWRTSTSETVVSPSGEVWRSTEEKKTEEGERPNEEREKLLDLGGECSACSREPEYFSSENTAALRKSPLIVATSRNETPQENSRTKKFSPRIFQESHLARGEMGRKPMVLLDDKIALKQMEEEIWNLFGPHYAERLKRNVRIRNSIYFGFKRKTPLR